MTAVTEATIPNINDGIWE